MFVCPALESRQDLSLVLRFGIARYWSFRANALADFNRSGWLAINDGGLA